MVLLPPRQVEALRCQAINAFDTSRSLLDRLGIAVKPTNGNGTSSVSAAFNALADTAAVTVAQVPASVSASAGDGQSAVLSTAVVIPPAVLVVDANGNPIAGVAVTFAVASGGGSVTGAAATTGANGVAAVGSWVVGATAGANSLTATVSGSGIAGNPVTFTATGVLSLLDIEIRYIPSPPSASRQQAFDNACNSA